MSGTRDILGALKTARRFVAVTPDDDDDLPEICQALNCSAAGTLMVIGADDTNAVAITVVAGWNPAAVKRVLSTGSDPITVVAAYNN